MTTWTNYTRGTTSHFVIHYMLCSVVVPFLLLLGQGRGVEGMDVAQLEAYGEGKLMFELEEELRKAIKDEKLPILDACIIASNSQASGIDSKYLVKKALLLDYQNVLRCAQSNFMLNWKDMRDYHWFYARASGERWFCADLWEDKLLDWETYWKEILRADNVEFFNYARGHFSSSELNGNRLFLQKHLESMDAVKILQSLNMNINSNGYDVHTLMGFKRFNTLRLLHKESVGMFSGVHFPSKPLDPEVLDFVLSIDKSALDVKRIAEKAIDAGFLYPLEILYHHRKEFPLDQEALTLAAKRGQLGILRWARFFAPEIQPDNECLREILISGHAQVFEFLNSHDPSFLPAAYNEKSANEHTMWHFVMIARVHKIAPHLVPLELLYAHAIELKIFDTAIWTGNKIYETTGKVAVTEKDFNVAIDSEAWLFVHWAAEKNPKMIMPGRDKLVVTGKDCKSKSEVLKKKRGLLVLLNHLYEKTKDVKYLPTVEELRNQPLKYLQDAHAHDSEYLSREDLMKICASKKTDTSIHEWLSGLGMNVATLEMASAAVSNNNRAALDWITERNPAAFSYKNSKTFGLGSFAGCMAEGVLEWVFDQAPETLPSWKRLRAMGCRTVSPRMLQKVKNYQKERKEKLAQEKADRLENLCH